MKDKSPHRSVPDEQPRPIVVCPLEFERCALRAHDLERSCDLHCCGPGSNSMTAWARQIPKGPRAVILAGLAGALDPKMKSGSAHVITAVMDDEGRPAPCSHLAEVGLSAQAACVIVSASTSVTSPQEKHALFQRTGANLVDLESQAFMTFAQQAGWRWLIIRGVSDGAEESLPRNIDQWVDQRGRNCAGTIARSIILNPALLLRLPRLRRSGLQAMSQVAEMIHKLHGHSAKHCRGLSV